MRVGILGSGPAAEAVHAAVADTDAATTTVDPETVGTADIAVAVGDAGADRFRRINDVVRDETPWLAVELGGLGGYPLADVVASVAGFAPGTGCYECLRTRVAANLDGDPGEDSGDTPGIDAAAARLAGAVAGREAARLLAGGESTVLGGIIEIPHARRRFLPVPGCACSDDSDGGTGTFPRDYEARDLDAVLERAEGGLDPRVGVVREVGEAESWPAPYYLATLCNTSGFSDATASEHAAGVDADWNRAFVKAVGEALERYAAGVYREADFERAAATDLDDAVPPARFVRSPAFPDPDPDEEHPWVAGDDLVSERAVYLPAEFVVFPPPEARHRPSITTGLGLGNSGVGALLSGLYEVVERDAAMLAWYSTYEPLGLAVDDDGYATLARRARSEDLEATALLLTQDVDVPVVAAAVHREEGWPRFAAGMAADLDPEAAARDALAEALQNWMELRGMGPDDAADEPGAIGHYADFPAAVRAFVSPGTTVPAARVGPSSIPEGAAELDAVVDRVADAGLDAFAARLTPRDVGALGFEAGRVLVPEAQPLFTGDPYFGERARRVPVDQGFEPRLEREHHPFP